MSNFPNMRYCAFQNTAAAMDQIGEMLQEAIDSNEALVISSSERWAYNSMYDKCQGLMQLLERYHEMLEENEEKDQ